MARDQSRLLQVVITGLLVSVTGQAQSTIYDDERVPVVGDRTVTYYGSYFGGVSTDYYYRDIEERSGSGGDGIEESVVEDQREVDQQALCDAISALVSPACNLMNPPVQTVNGCGGGAYAWAVPDYLIINGAPLLRPGPIFELACNKHDICYGTYLADKGFCDNQLRADMVQEAKDSLSSFQWIAYSLYVYAQAGLYSTVLQEAPILSVAQGLYASAQQLGECRAYSKQAAAAGCLD